MQGLPSFHLPSTLHAPRVSDALQNLPTHYAVQLLSHTNSATHYLIPPSVVMVYSQIQSKHFFFIAPFLNLSSNLKRQVSVPYTTFGTITLIQLPPTTKSYCPDMKNQILAQKGLSPTSTLSLNSSCGPSSSLNHFPKYLRVIRIFKISPFIQKNLL